MQNRGEKGKNEDYVGPFIYLVYLVMLFNSYFVDIKNKTKNNGKNNYSKYTNTFCCFCYTKSYVIISRSPMNAFYSISLSESSILYLMFATNNPLKII